MRDLLFKNLTSLDKKRKKISVIEVTQDQSIKIEIKRHFICFIREVSVGSESAFGGNEKNLERPSPYLYVLKKHNSKEKKENFFCRLKGSLYAVNNNRLYLIIFCHSLKINLVSLSEIAKI